MDSQHPSLEVRAPDGKEYIIRLEDIIQQEEGKNHVTLGRSNDNDIVLNNFEKKVTRRKHCVFERGTNGWWVVDESSSNGTFVQRGKNEPVDVRKDGRFRLKNGDVLLILGKWVEPDEPVFWKLTFRDPGETEQVSNFKPPAYLEYSLSQEKLFRISGREQEEIDLSPQQRALIHYMAQRNQANNNQPVVCRYEELISAIWGDPFNHDSGEVNHLVFGVRKKVESDSGKSEFFQTVKGLGYRLKVELIG